MKDIFLLGASGSIGQQTIDVIESNPHLFTLNGITVGHNTSIIDKVLKKHKLHTVYLIDDEKKEELKTKYPEVTFYSSETSLVEVLENTPCEWVVSSLSGFSGFEVTIKAIEMGKNIALANKEVLVAGGEFVMNLVKKYQVQLTPIDSEHSALYQVLSSHSIEEVDHVIITASGGSFRDLSRDELKNVTLQDALKHPNWSMGNKITIDSATMMNKAFEVIEAHHLYGLDYNQIKVLISPNSIVHGLVVFKDTSILSQWATSDMRLPILYALSDQKHLKLEIEPLDLSKGLSIDLKPLNLERYPVFKAALRMMSLNKDACCVMNAINEVGVQLFLNEKINFLQLEQMITDLCMSYLPEELVDVYDVYKANDKGEALARNYVREHYGI